MAEMHPLLAALLAEYRAGKYSEAQYEDRRKVILRDEIGLGAGTTSAAPQLPTAENGVTVVSKAELQRQDQARIQAAIQAGRKSGKMHSYSAKAEVRAVTRAVPVVGGKGDAMRFLNNEEFAQAQRAAEQLAATLADRATLPAAPVDYNGANLDIAPGFQVVDGIISPINNAPFSGKVAAKVVNPEIEAIRARWKAGAFGPTTRTDGKKCSECHGLKKAHGNSCANCGGKGAEPPDSLIQARKLMAAVKPVPTEFDVDGAYNPKDITAGRIDCQICHGKPDKITGNMCRCGGKGYFIVDMGPVIARSNRGATCADPMQESEDEMTYTAYLTTGLCNTIHAPNGPKAVRSAVNSLRNGASYTRVKLDNRARDIGGRVVMIASCMLWLHDYDTQCEQCHGEGKSRKCATCKGSCQVTVRRGMGSDAQDVSLTCADCKGTGKDHPCAYCEDGRVTRRGKRFFFEDRIDTDEKSPTFGQVTAKAVDLAHAAGLAAMTGFDPEAQCGREKCKGQDCYACKDAKQGGYQVKGYVPCSECRATGKINGVPHEKCKGKGRFNPLEFYWISDEPLECKACKGKSDNVKKHCPSCAGSCQVNAFTVTDEIRRHDVLEEDRLPLRDRPLTIMIGGDAVVVGAGKVPSRKSGAVLHLTGTARNKWDTAAKLYGSQEIVGEGSKARWSHKATQGIGAGQTVKPYTATFSKG